MGQTWDKRNAIKEINYWYGYNSSQGWNNKLTTDKTTHAEYQKIENLQKDAVINDTQKFQILAEISETSEIYSKYKQPPVKPSVGLSMTHIFN